MLSLSFRDAGLTLALALPLVVILLRRNPFSADPDKSRAAPGGKKDRDDTATTTSTNTTTNTIMQAPREDLQPPKDDPFTQEELRAYDGSNPDKPVYVAIKGACPAIVLLVLAGLLSIFLPSLPCSFSLSRMHAQERCST
jgi:hypothetical protein